MTRRTVLLLVVTVTAMLLAASGVAMAATTVGGTPDAGTVQTDGQVSAVVASGGKVYLAGYFTHVNGVARNHLAAVDAVTGEITSWDPGANDAVRALAISPDGTRIYAGGSFTSVGGVARNRLAAINTSTGTIDASWTPRTNDSVRAIAVRGNSVYVGGRFTTVNGQSRTRLALLDATTGALDPSWAPSANDLVRTLGVSSDGSRIYAGGDFTTVSGNSRPYLAALDPSTGTLYSAWTRPTTPNGPVFDLQEVAGRLYSAEAGPGGALTAYDPSTGSRVWRKTADGDVQSLAVMGGEVYAGGHFVTFSSYARQFFAAVDATTGATDPTWGPSAYGANCSSVWTPDPCDDSVWALEAAPAQGRLYAGGDFRKVSGAAHAGFARFSYPSAGSDSTPPETTIDSGPSGTVGSASAAFAFSSSEPGSTYECSLDGALYKPCSSPQSYTGLADGSHTFSVRATDAAGNADPTPATRSWTVDTIVPSAPVIFAPAENGTAPASFALSGTAEAGSTVEVFEGLLSMGTTRTDASGAWSKALSNVAGGTHTYMARATDDAGNASALSGPRTLTVDTTAPAVNSVTPADGTVNVAVASNVVAAFSEAMTAATIDGTTFTLVQQGGVTPVAATVSYDAQSKEAILNPDADLQAGTNYTATIKTGVKDLAGNALANDEVWSFSTADATPPADTTPPETTIDSGPSGTVASASATFAFSASETGSSFECSLDGAAFAPCASPKDYTSLSDGSHTFRVRATDAAGNADATPAERDWTVSTAPTQKTRNVLAFDGVDDWVSIKSSSWLNLTPSTQRTYEAWIQTGQNVSARQFVYEEGGDPNGFSVEISGGRLYFNAWSNTNGWRTLSASAPVNPDTIYRVAGVYDQPGGQVRLYVDGVLAGSSSGAGPMYEHADGVALGSISGATRDHANKIVTSGSNFGGRLGEFRAWDHARSQSQISGALEANLSGTEPGLIALYKLGEGGGTTLKDSGPRKIDGTLSGAAWETLTYTPIG